MKGVVEAEETAEDPAVTEDTAAVEGERPRAEAAYVPAGGAIVAVAGTVPGAGAAANVAITDAA